jgi:DNA-binding MurR/RpiR family transcriptional regulator
MESTSLEERIRSSYDDLSSSHRRLATYLLQEDVAGAFSTARQLAKTLGVSEATVVRLAPALGYEGFPDLQAELRRRLLSRAGWQPPMTQAIETLPSDASGVFRQVLENDIASLKSTLAGIDLEAFERAVQAIRKAHTVYFVGMRSLAPHALYGTMRLRLVHHRTGLLSAHVGDLADQMLALEVGDLLVALSYYRYAADTVRALQYARDRGIRTLLITDNPVSPPAKSAEIVLVAHEASLKLFHSLVAPLSLLNALIAAATVLDKDVSTKNLAQAYKTVDLFETFLAPTSASELGEEHFSGPHDRHRPIQARARVRTPRKRRAD